MRTDVEQLVRELPEAGIARATRLGLVLNPGLETETWRGLVTHVARLVRSSTGARQTLTAWLGDALAYGEAGGRGFITECAAATGINPGTLRNAKMICLRIPVSCRRDTLSWTHHCEVGIAFADPQEIERWLAVAEAARYRGKLTPAGFGGCAPTGNQLGQTVRSRTARRSLVAAIRRLLFRYSRTSAGSNRTSRPR